MSDFCPESSRQSGRLFTHIYIGENSVKILFINNDGGGFADYIEVPHGTTVQQLFGKQIQGGKAEDYLIRVNRQPAAKDQELEEGNRVSMTPLKIEGAGSQPGIELRLAA